MIHCCLFFSHFTVLYVFGIPMKTWAQDAAAAKIDYQSSYQSRVSGVYRKSVSRSDLVLDADHSLDF